MFTDEDIGDLSFEARWLFAGLFTQADREGRLEDRPRKLKVEVMPYDNVNIEHLLRELTEARFITRYEAEGKRYIHIRTFWKHQHFNIKEPPSQLPAPLELKGGTVSAPVKHGASTVPAPVENARKGREGVGREGKEKLEASGVSTVPNSASPPGFLSEEFLRRLEEDPAYQGIEVRHVYAKMLFWCEEHGKEVKEGRLISWLNHEDRPRKGNGAENDTRDTKAKIARVVQDLSRDRDLE